MSTGACGSQARYKTLSVLADDRLRRSPASLFHYPQ